MEMGAGDVVIDKMKTMQTSYLELSGLKVRVKLAHMDENDTIGGVWYRKGALFDISPRFE